MPSARLVSAFVSATTSASLAGRGSSSPSAAAAPALTRRPLASTDFQTGETLAISPDGKSIGRGSMASQSEVASVLWDGGSLQVLQRSRKGAL
jgi:hypothetical protein